MKIDSNNLELPQRQPLPLIDGRDQLVDNPEVHRDNQLIPQKMQYLDQNELRMQHFIDNNVMMNIQEAKEPLYQESNVNDSQNLLNNHEPMPGSEEQEQGDQSNLVGKQQHRMPDLFKCVRYHRKEIGPNHTSQNQSDCSRSTKIYKFDHAPEQNTSKQLLDVEQAALKKLNMKSEHGAVCSTEFQKNIFSSAHQNNKTNKEQNSQRVNKIFKKIKNNIRKNKMLYSKHLNKIKIRGKRINKLKTKKRHQNKRLTIHIHKKMKTLRLSGTKSESSDLSSNKQFETLKTESIFVDKENVQIFRNQPLDSEKPVVKGPPLYEKTTEHNNTPPRPPHAQDLLDLPAMMAAQQVELLNNPLNTDFAEPKKSGGKRASLGRWTQEEHTRFICAIQLYGKDWRKVQEFIGSRTTLQIRSHAQKYFINWQKKAGAVDVNEKGFTQKCVNELLKKLQNDDPAIEGTATTTGLPQFPTKKERGIFAHSKQSKKHQDQDKAAGKLQPLPYESKEVSSAPKIQNSAPVPPQLEKKCQISKMSAVSPLLKTMNVRDTSKYEFEVIKYCREDFISDPQVLQEAQADINYDEYLMPKPAFIERISQEYYEMILERNRLNKQNQIKYVIEQKMQLMQQRMYLLQPNNCSEQACLHNKELQLINQILNDPDERVAWYDIRLSLIQLDRQRDLATVEERMKFFNEKLAQDRNRLNYMNANSAEAQQTHRQLKLNLKRLKQYQIDQRNLQKEIDRFKLFAITNYQLTNWYQEIQSKGVPLELLEKLDQRIKSQKLYNNDYDCIMQEIQDARDTYNPQLTNHICGSCWSKNISYNVFTPDKECNGGQDESCTQDEADLQHEEINNVKAQNYSLYNEKQNDLLKLDQSNDFTAKSAHNGKLQLKVQCIIPKAKQDSASTNSRLIITQTVPISCLKNRTVHGKDKLQKTNAGLTTGNKRKFKDRTVKQTSIDKTLKSKKQKVLEQPKQLQLKQQFQSRDSAEKRFAEKVPDLFRGKSTNKLTIDNANLLSEESQEYFMDKETVRTLDTAFFTLLDEINQIIRINPDFARYLIAFKCILNVINMKLQNVQEGGSLNIERTNIEIERFIKIKALEINLEDMTTIYNRIYGEDQVQSKEGLAQQLQLLRLQGFHGNLQQAKIQEVESDIIRELQLLNFVCTNSNQYKDLALSFSEQLGNENPKSTTTNPKDSLISSQLTILQSFLNKILEQKRDIYEIFELHNIQRNEIEDYFSKMNMIFSHSRNVFEYNQLEKMRQLQQNVELMKTQIKYHISLTKKKISICKELKTCKLINEQQLEGQDSQLNQQINSHALSNQSYDYDFNESARLKHKLYFLNQIQNDQSEQLPVNNEETQLNKSQHQVKPEEITLKQILCEFGPHQSFTALSKIKPGFSSQTSTVKGVTTTQKKK